MIKSVRDQYDDSEWVDVTRVGVPYREELNQRTGQWRHARMFMNGTSEEWKSGPAPKGREDG